MKSKKVSFGDPKKKKRKSRKKLRKRKKRTPLAIVKDKLWDLCKEYCRKRWGNVCYTCGAKNLIGSNWHTGHCYPSSICPFILDYHYDNLRPQCYHCNINCGGMGAIFKDKLQVEHGVDYVENLKLMLHQPSITKATISDYEEYIELYKKLIKEL